MVWSMGGWYIWVSTYKGVVSIGVNRWQCCSFGVQRHCRYWLANASGRQVVFVTSQT